MLQQPELGSQLFQSFNRGTKAEVERLSEQLSHGSRGGASFIFYRCDKSSMSRDISLTASSHHSGEVKAGTRAVSHMAARVRSREETDTPMLPACSCLVSFFHCSAGQEAA